MKSLTVVMGSRKPKAAKNAMSKGKVPKGKVKHISVKPMDNGGFTVESDHEMPPQKAKTMGLAMPDYDRGTHRAGFADAGTALKHLGGLMGAGAPPPGEPDGDEGTPDAGDDETAGE